MTCFGFGPTMFMTDPERKTNHIFYRLRNYPTGTTATQISSSKIEKQTFLDILVLGKKHYIQYTAVLTPGL